MCSTNPCGNKKKIEFQKVVIPRGMINPQETTVIEIPTNLQKQPIVVAKRKMDQPGAPDNNTNKSRKAPGGTRNGYESPRTRPPFAPGNMYDNSGPPRSYPQYNNQTDGFQQTVDLEATERQEREQLQRDLDEFQRARRKLLANTSHLVNGEENKPGGRSYRSKQYY